MAGAGAAPRATPVPLRFALSDARMGNGLRRVEDSILIGAPACHRNPNMTDDRIREAGRRLGEAWLAAELAERAVLHVAMEISSD